eukprot:Gb_17168 [translate_table: standard]
MSSSGLVLSNSPDQAVMKGSTSLRKRPTSYDDVLKQISNENICIQSPATSGNASNEKRCLCAPTTHVGSFRCRLHRSSQKQWSSISANNGTRAVLSLQTSAPSVRSVPFKLLVGDKNGRRSLTSTAKNALRSVQANKPSRLSKMASVLQSDSNPALTTTTEEGNSAKMDD